MRPALLLALVVAVAGVSQGGALRGGEGDLSQEADAVRAWIASLQFNATGTPGHGAVRVHDMYGHYNGSLPGSEGWYRVVPYFASQGMLGYVRSDASDRFERTWDYVAWHLRSNNDTDGRILDHWYTDGGAKGSTCPPLANGTSCDHEDASDSYASTLLTLARAYRDEGGNLSRFNDTGVRAELERTADLVLGLMDPADNLTWNLGPSSNATRAKYLMDNAESYAGLRAMQHLEATVYGDAAQAARYGDNATALRAAILAHLHGDASVLGAPLPGHQAFAAGKGIPADPAVWYWSGPQQAWPILAGVVGPGDAEAQAALDYLQATWGAGPRNWTHNLVDHTGNSWASVGYAAHLAGREAHAATHVEYVLCRVLDPLPGSQGGGDFPYPFHVGDAGFLLQSLDAGVARSSGAVACPGTDSAGVGAPLPP